MMDEAERFNEQLDRLFENQDVDERDPLLRLSRSLRASLTPVAPAPRFRADLKAELLERYANNVRPFPAPVRPTRPSLRWARRAALGALVAAAASMGVIYGYGNLHQQATPQPSTVSQHFTPTPSATPPAAQATTRRPAFVQPGQGAPGGQPGNGDAPPAAPGGHTSHGGHAGHHPSTPPRHGNGGPVIKMARPTRTPGAATQPSPEVAQHLTATPTTPPPTATTPPTATLPPATATAPAPTATLPPASTATPPTTRATSGAVIVPQHPLAASPTARSAATQPRPTSTPIPSTATPVPPTATPMPPTATARPTRAVPSATLIPPTARPTAAPRHVTLEATATPIPPTRTPIPAAPTATETPMPPATATSIAAPSDTPVPALPSATPTAQPPVTAVAQVSVTPHANAAGQNPGSPTPPTAASLTFPAPSAANAGPASPLANTQVYTPAVSLQLPAALSAAPGSSIAVFAPAPQQESALTTLRALNLAPEAVLLHTRSETDARVHIDSRAYLARLMPNGTGYHLTLALTTPDQATAPTTAFDGAAATAAAHRFLAARGLDAQLGDAVAMQNGAAMTVTLTQRYAQPPSYPLVGAQTVLTFDANGVLTGADIHWVDTAVAVVADAVSPAQALATLEAGRGLIAISGGVVPDPSSTISGETILYVPVLGAGGAAYYEPVYQFTGATSSNVPFQIYVSAVSPSFLR